jgi:hypothetical protein
MEKSSLQKAVKSTARLAWISKPVTCHTFSFATDLLQDGYDIRTVQELLRQRKCVYHHDTYAYDPEIFFFNQGGHLLSAEDASIASQVTLLATKSVP